MKVRVNLGMVIGASYVAALTFLPLLGFELGYSSFESIVIISLGLITYYVASLKTEYAKESTGDVESR